MLIFYDNFVAEGIFVDALDFECKVVWCDVIFVILESAEAVSN